MIWIPVSFVPVPIRVLFEITAGTPWTKIRREFKPVIMLFEIVVVLPLLSTCTPSNIVLSEMVGCPPLTHILQLILLCEIVGEPAPILRLNGVELMNVMSPI